MFVTHDIKAREFNDTVKCKLAPSKIHGVGVFAIRKIKKGERMWCRKFERRLVKITKKEFGKVYPGIRELILQRWPVVLEGDPFLHPNEDAYMISFMNHADKDWNYDELTDTARRDINAGEEVLTNVGRFKEELLKIK